MSRILLHFNPPVTMLHAWLVRSSGLFIRERSLALRGLLLIRTRRGMPLRSEGRWHFNLATFSSHVQMLPFEIGEQLNLTLARPYLTFNLPRARKRDCTSDISNIVVFNRYTYPATNTPYFKSYLSACLSAFQLPTPSLADRDKQCEIITSIYPPPHPGIIREMNCNESCKKKRSKGKFEINKNNEGYASDLRKERLGEKETR